MPVMNSLPGLRRGCRFRVAITHQNPDACPADRVMPGRDPLCLAWSSRRSRLCQALSPDEARLCRAVMKESAEACADLDESIVLRCNAYRARYPELARPEQTGDGFMPTVLEIQWVRTSRDGAESRGTESFRFARWGVQLIEAELFYEIDLRDPLELPARVGLRHHENRRLRMSLRIPRGREFPVRLSCPEHCRVDFLGGEGLVVSQEEEGVVGHIDWAELEPTRGGTVWFSFRLTKVDEIGTLVFVAVYEPLCEM